MPYKGGMSKWQEKAESKLQLKSRLSNLALPMFMLFTAYDTQKLKYYYAYYGGDASMLHKSSIIGALSLYLDYINIFLYIVRIVGRSHRND